MTKKILATILAIAMVITSMGTMVFAESDPDTLVSSGGTVIVNDQDTEYASLTEAATAEATAPVDGVITYTINGPVEYITGTELAKGDAATVKIIAATNAETDSITLRKNYHLGFQCSGDLTIENITVNDLSDYDSKGDPVVYPNGCESSLTQWEFMNIIFNRGTTATVLCKNVTFTEGVMVDDDDDVSFEGCTFNVYADNWARSKYALWIASSSEIVVDNCEFNGDRAIKVDDTYGDNIVDIVVKNSKFNNLSQKPAIVYSNDNGGSLEIDNNTVITEKYGKGILAVEAPVTLSGSDVADLKASVTSDGETTYYSTVEEAVSGNDIVAKTDDSTYFETLEDAFKNATNDTTITFLCDVAGDGIVIDKSITIDLGGYTYTINGTLVGSKGTETLGLQILRDNDVTIKNGTIKGSKDATKGNETNEVNGLRVLIQNYSNLTLDDVTLDYGDADKIGYVLSNNYGEIALTGETSIIAPAGKFAFDVYDYTAGGYPSAPEMTINTTGVINGAFEVSETAGLEIESGYFTHNPSAYLAEGMAAVTSDSSNAKFMIAEKKVDVETTVTPSSPSVSVEEGIEINTDNFAADTDDLNAASSTLANDSSVVGTKEDATAALEDAEITVTEDDTVSVVVVPYTNINVSNVDNENKTMTVTIEPKYDVIATTNSDEIIIEGDGKNAVVLNSNQTLNVNTPMTLTVALPADYAGEDEETVYVHHEIDGTTYVYEAALSADKTTATFTNTNGFSSTEFVVKKEAGAAKIGDVIYATLSDAVKNVKNDETIVLLADNAETVKVAKTITFSLDKDVHAFTGAIDNGSYTKVTTTENGNVITYTFKYTSGSLGGGGGAGGGGGGGAVVSAYTIKVKSADNGTVTASSKTAKKGATITLSVTADEGYELKSITVTDNDNEEVAVTEDNGEYSFKMPASDVVVTAEFVAEGTVETPDDNETNNFPFADIAEDFWGYEAIAYCFENGIMNGMTETEFDQARPLTRAMLVTMLYRLAGTPEVVTDEADWWSTAKAWAMECGISDGTFMTEEVTREQLVTMLYRYAGMIEADLTATAELTSFTDSASISDYAVDSVKWAYASELINGMGDGTFAPTSSATRAQVATIFMRFIENIVK